MWALVGGRIGSLVGLTGRELFDDEATGGGGSGFTDANWLAVCGRMASPFNAAMVPLILLAPDDSAFFKAGFGRHWGALWPFELTWCTRTSPRLERLIGPTPAMLTYSSIGSIFS